MTGFAALKRGVVDSGLCVHCGTCAGVCSAEAIDIRDVLGKCEPYQVGRCVECGLCVQICPGKKVDFNSLTLDWTDLHNHPMLGQFSKIFVGHSKSEDIRHKGASGGIGTAILLHLLDEQAVDGVVVLDFSKRRPWFPEVKIVNQRDEVIRAAQSKYFIYPQNRILKVIRESYLKKIAFFGLPCQVHGIKKAIQERIPGTEKIKYVLGIYCGNNLYYDATISLFKRFGFKDLSQIKMIAYRDGEYPGNFVITNKNGRKRIIDKFTFNYLSFFYIPFRCLFCIDQTNEFADLSIGDAWKGAFVEKCKKGNSIILVRHPDFLSFFERGKKKGLYEFEEITEDTAVRMHANVLDNKKVGAYARMIIWRKIGKEIPNYSVKGKKISFKRYCIEAINLLILSICSINVLKALESSIPLKLISPFIKYVRGIWRKKAAKDYIIRI